MRRLWSALLVCAIAGSGQLSTRVVTEIPNDGSTGTTLNKLAKMTGAPSKAVVTSAGDTSGAIGLVIGGAGTAGYAVIATTGQQSCVFDGATTAGHYVQQSASVNGDCTDAGSSCPSNGQLIGRVLSTNGGAGTYVLQLGSPCPGGVTFGTDLASIDSTHQQVVGLLTKPINSTSSTIGNGEVLAYSSSSGKWEAVAIPLMAVGGVPGQPTTGQETLLFAAPTPMVFDVDFATSGGLSASCGIGPNGLNATGSETFTVKKGSNSGGTWTWSTIGTVVVSTTTTCTYATTSHTTQTLNTGNVLALVSPNPADATLSSFTVTLVAWFGTTVPANAAAAPIFSCRTTACTYDGSTTYQPYDVVTYSGSTYFCKVGSTGNLPTNTTYWNQMAAAGAAGANGTNGTNGTNGVVGITGSLTVGNLVSVASSTNIQDTGVAISTDGTAASNSDAKAMTEKAVVTYVGAHGGKNPYPAVTAPPALSNWTWANQGTATGADVDGGISLTMGAGSGDNVRVLYRALPSAPYTITAAIFVQWANTNFFEAGICQYDSVGAKELTYGLASNSGLGLRVVTRTAVNGSGSAANSLAISYPSLINVSGVIWLRMQDDNANRIYYYSVDGRNWIQQYSVARTTTLTPDSAGIVVNPNNASSGGVVTLVSWQVTTP